ncbi:Major surface antigen 4 precursor [Anaplasma phagocytophilum]|nr:Major surface antigen 4 precursor [Anaplasma phagocytophilum]
MKITSSKINGEVCKLGSSNKYGNGESNDGELTCGVGHNSGKHSDSAKGGLKEFGYYVLETEGYKHWPKTQGTADKEKDNAAKVAADLTKLTSEDRTVVAGLLAKTIEGGEVVEIRAVSSTSVMVNACYDLLSEGLGVVPYACVGLGGNFVGVVDGTRRTIRWVSTLYAHSKSLGKIGAASLQNKLRSAILHTYQVCTVALHSYPA